MILFSNKVIDEVERGEMALKKLITVILGIIIISVAFAIPVFADSISTINAAIDESKRVTINGIISSGAGQTVIVKVMDPGGIVDYLNSTVSISGGNFSFTYTMKNHTAGTYTVTLNALGVSNPVKTSFEYGVNNSLRDISISSGGFDKTFSPETMQYSVKVDNRIDSITVTPVADDKTAGIKVNNQVVESGNPSLPIKLDAGKNTINISVTSLSGKTKMYMIIVNKEKTIAATITANTSIDNNKQVKVSGAVSSGPGQIVSVKVTDPKGSIDYINRTLSTGNGQYEYSYNLSNKTTGRYTVTVGALGVPNPTASYFDYISGLELENIEISDGSLSPAFNPDLEQYTVVVGNNIENIRITPTASGGTGSIVVNGMSVSSGIASEPIKLNAGNNSVKITALSHDGRISKTYTITVIKSIFSLAGGAVSAEVNKEGMLKIEGYIGSEAERQISVMVTDPEGGLEYIGTTKSITGGRFDLTYTITNTARGRYSVSVGALELPVPLTAYFMYYPGITDLKDLTIYQADLSPQFSPDMIEYNTKVKYDVTNIRILATTMYTEASLKVNGLPVKSGEPSQYVNLNEGYNTINIDVSGPNGSFKTYSIRVLRGSAPSPKSINKYTVSFNSNGGSMVGSQTVNYNATATEPAVPSRTGYTFGGWYTDDATFNNAFAFTTAITGDITLYAKWTANPTYRLSYNSNGATGGSVPDDGNAYEQGAIVTVLGNTGNLIRAGYTFAGWNTQADGNGTSYAQGATFTMGTANVILYAKWTSNPTYRVSYNSNGATGGSVPGDVNAYEQGAIVTVLGNTGNLVRSGYNFSGWNTQADGNGTDHEAGDTFTIGSSNVILYAKWMINTYTVSFNSNGGSGIGSQTVNYNTTVAEPGAPIRTGYTFGGWYTDDTTFSNAFSFTTAITEDITLYAKWTANIYTINISDTVNGTITANLITATFGDTVNLTITPASGWKLKDGSLKYNDGVNNQTISDSSFIMPASNVTITAEFIELSNDATLNSLVVQDTNGQILVFKDANGSTITFDAETSEYYLVLTPIMFNDLTICLTPTVNESHATVKVQNNLVSSGIAWVGVPDSFPLEIQVLAEDGTTEKLYYLAIYIGQQVY